MTLSAVVHRLHLLKLAPGHWSKEQKNRRLYCYCQLSRKERRDGQKAGYMIHNGGGRTVRTETWDSISGSLSNQPCNFRGVSSPLQGLSVLYSKPKDQIRGPVKFHVRKAPLDLTMRTRRNSVNREKGSKGELQRFKEIWLPLKIWKIIIGQVWSKHVTLQVKTPRNLKSGHA